MFLLIGFSGESALWLLSERGVSGLGTECIDVELGWKTRNQVKQTLAAQNKVKQLLGQCARLVITLVYSLTFRSHWSS